MNPAQLAVLKRAATMKNRQQAIEIAKRCDDAYSFDRYLNWTAVAEKLLRAGLTEKQAEAVMRFKWARWAADQAAGKYAYGQFPAKVLVEYTLKQGMKEVEKLTAETFSE